MTTNNSITMGSPSKLKLSKSGKSGSASASVRDLSRISQATPIARTHSLYRDPIEGVYRLLPADQPTCPGSFSKRVHEPWYQRYAEILDGEDKLLTIQPFGEVAHEELDRAMKMKYGHHYKSIYANELSESRIKDQMEKNAVKYYHKILLKNQEQNRSDVSLARSTSPDPGYASINLRMTISGSNKSKTETPIDNRWHNLTKNMRAKAYFKQSINTIRKEMARKRFIRVAVLTKSLNRFKRALINNRYSLEIMLLELPETPDAPGQKKKKDLTMRNTFDSQKYLSQKSEGETSSIPWPTVYTLTKPWYARDIEEVGEAVKILYPLLFPNDFPVKVQMQIAHVAWYTRLQKNRPISREGNTATCFTIVLSGQVVVTELIKDRVVPKGKPMMRFVKYINKGEAFGDHETEMLYRTRIYSAYSASTCEILTVDYEDYQENQRIYFNPVTERAPQHIECLKKLPLFKTISRRDLIRSARDHIQLVYFRNMQIMATSLRDSDFVFVVMTGQCHTVIKQKVSEKPSKNATLTKPTTTHRHAAVRILKTEGGAQNEEIKLEHLQTRFYKDKSDVTCCKFVKSWMTQGFVMEIKRISERSLTISKEEAVKEIERLRLTRAVCDVYGHDFVHKVAVDLVEKMHVHEVANREYEADIKRLKKQRVVLLRRLNRTLNETECMSRLKDQIARKAIHISEGNGRAASMTQTREKQTADIARLSTVINQDATGNTGGKLSATGEFFKQKIRAPSMFMSLLRATSSNRTGKMDLNDFGLSEYFLDTSSPSASPANSSKGEKSSKERQCPDSPISGVEADEEIDPNHKSQFKSKKRPSYGAHAEEYEYSAPVERFIRGDLIGNGYVNYNNGKYREPEVDCALVSNGTEVIVVRKSYLLERLYNHQRKYNEMIGDLVSSDSESN